MPAFAPVLAATIDTNYTSGFGLGTNCYTDDGTNFYSQVAGPMTNIYVNPTTGVMYDLFYLATAADQGPVTLSGGPRVWTKTQRLTGASIMSISVNDYGASPSATAAENDAAFAAAVAVMTAGTRLIIPNGDYTINNWVFNPPDDCVLDCFGTLISAASGDAVTIGGTGNTWRFRYSINRLKIKSPTRDITAGRSGVRLQNLYESTISIERAEGFEKGVFCWADGTTQFIGFSYNKVSLSRIVDNKYGVYLDHGAVWGFVNENVFYGGRFSWSSVVTDASNHVHIYIADKAVEPINSNRFEKPNLEAVNNSWNSAPGVQRAGVRAYVDNGIHNKIIDGRVEWETSTATNTMFTFGVNAKYGLIEGGLDTLNTNVEDLSVAGSNRTWTRTGIFIRSIDTLSPAFTLRAQSSNSQILFQGENIAGGQTSQITALGLANFKSVTLGTLAINQGLFAGSGSPETVVTAYQGSVYLNNNANETRIWVKGSGADALNWCEHIGARVVNTNQVAPNGPGCRLTYFMNCNGAAKTVTLPLTTNCKGMIITVVKTDAGAFNVTTPLTGGDVVFGGAVVLAAQGAKVTYESDGAGTWWQI